MTDPTAARAFLVAEVEALEPFDFVAVVPTGQPLHAVEATRAEDGRIDVRVPGRPPAVPPLEGEVRRGLLERGFASDDPSDPTQPWACTVAEPDAAVALLLAVLVEVFGEKPTATLDVAHGSHQAAHEARKNLARARTRIETIVADILGRPPEQDADGDYVVPIDDVQLMVAPRAAPDGRVFVRVFVVTNVGVNVTPELGLILARLNFGLMFGRFALDVEHRSVWFDDTLLGAEFREEELRFAIHMVARTADDWDDRLKQMFGGATYQEVVAGQANGVASPTKPGEGVGLYL